MCMWTPEETYAGVLSFYHVIPRDQIHVIKLYDNPYYLISHLPDLSVSVSLFLFCFVFYVCECFSCNLACVYMIPVEQGVGCAETGITDGFELSCGY